MRVPAVPPRLAGPRLGGARLAGPRLAESGLTEPRLAELRHVYACSDIHTDHEENMAWVRALDDGRYRSDVLLVAGDVSNGLSTFCETMETLTSAFGLVFFVTGNHDLWMWSDDAQRLSHRPYEHSLEKLERMKASGTLTDAQFETSKNRLLNLEV